MIGAHGANLWLRNARGDLPLHEAAASGRRDLVKWLLESRPSQVNARNNDGRCPLHLAALNDNADMCKVRSIDINFLQSRQREIALDYFEHANLPSLSSESSCIMGSRTHRKAAGSPEQFGEIYFQGNVTFPGISKVIFLWTARKWLVG